MSPAEHAPVRSYQRIFCPDRRLYQVEGHRIPVPGGVPLRWVGYAAAALLAIVLLSTRSPLLSAFIGLGVAAASVAYGSRSTAALAALAAAGGSQVVGYMLATIGWPLRLIVLPALLATVATQATPDGRAAHRYARTWLVMQLRPERRTLGRALPGAERSTGLNGRLHVAGDARGPRLRRARIHGAALVRFAQPVQLVERRRGWQVSALPVRGSRAVVRVDVAAGERLEVRP